MTVVSNLDGREPYKLCLDANMPGLISALEDDEQLSNSNDLVLHDVIFSYIHIVTLSKPDGQPLHEVTNQHAHLL